MAKKKKAKKTEEAAPKPKKAEIRAYYKENGWRNTVSHFGLAPKDLSPIVQGVDGPSGPKKPPKKKKKKDADKAPKRVKKAKVPKGKSAEAPYGYKKDGTPRKPPGRKAAGKEISSEAAPKKKRGRGRPKKDAGETVVKTKTAKKRPGRPKGTSSAVPASTASTNEMVLDWLLAYRNKNQKAGHMLPLDSVIIDLTMKVRK